MSILFALAAAAATPLSPAPLSADQRGNLGCAAMLALAAGEQGRGRWGDLPRLATEARGYFVDVGGALIRGGRSAESVSALFRAQAASLRAAGPLKRADVMACIATMRASNAQ